jgi:hypothetical protein
MTREGEISPSRLTIAQASLLNLHGKSLNPSSQSQLPSSPNQSSLLSVLPQQQRHLPSSSFDDGEPDGQGLYYQFPAPPSTRYAPVGPSPLFRPPLLLSQEEEDQYEPLSLKSLPGRGSRSGSSTRARAGSELGYVDLPAVFNGMGNARTGGYTPAEKLILQAHSQGRFYSRANTDSMEVPGGRKGEVAGEGGVLYPASQQQQYRLSLHSYQQQPRPLQQQQQTIATQFNVNKIGHSQNIIQQRTHHISNTDDNSNSRRRVLDFEQLQQYQQLQQQQSYSDHSISSSYAVAQSIPSNNASVNQLRIPAVAAAAKSSESSNTHLHRHRATPPPLLSNDYSSQRYYHYQHHSIQHRRHNFINYNDNHNHNDNNTIILPQANQRALVLYDEKKREEECEDGEKNVEENAHVAGDAKGSPFFDYNQHHHDDAMRHAGAVHRYSNSRSAYDSAQFVVQTAVAVTTAAAEEMKVNEEIVSPALTYGSTSSRTPSTLSPATPFFGTFGPPPLTSSSRGALGKDRGLAADADAGGDGVEGGNGLEVVVSSGGRLN